MSVLHFTADDRVHRIELWRLPLDVVEEDIAVTPQVGDANSDGRFDELDLVAVLQAGKYNTPQPSTLEEGDFNGDRLLCPSAYGEMRFDKHARTQRR